MKDLISTLIKFSNTEFNWKNFSRIDFDNNGRYLADIESNFTDPLFDVHVEIKAISSVGMIPENFILLTESPVLVKKIGEEYFSSANEKINIAQYTRTEIIYLSIYPKKLDSPGFINVIYSLYPKINFLTLLTVPFVLIPAFYANLFNTRLIFNDAVDTLIFVTLLFFTLWSIDYFVKFFIKQIHLNKVDKNSLKVENYLFRIIPYLSVANLISKIRIIESSKKVIWESLSGIIVDAVSFLMIMGVMFILVGNMALILLVFYSVIMLSAVFLRYRNYKIYIESEAAQQDLLVERVSYYKNNDQLQFFDVELMAKKFDQVCKQSFKTDHEVSNFNFQWEEFVRFSGFVASFVLFSVIFFSAKEDVEVFNILIALLILNGRVSSSAVSLISKSFYTLVSTYHMKEASTAIFTDLVATPFNKGIYLSSIHRIALKNVSIEVDGHPIINNIDLNLEKGNIYGFFGSVGSGKSTLLQTIIGKHVEFDGLVQYNNLYSVDNLDRNFFADKVSYLNPSSDFIQGSIQYNFEVRGTFNKNRIAAVCKKIFPLASIDYEFLFQKNIMTIPMSTGQKRKLLFFMSANKNKELIILDETFVNMTSMDIVILMKFTKLELKNAIVIIVSHDRNVLSMLSNLYEISNLKLKLNKTSVVKLQSNSKDPTSSL